MAFFCMLLRTLLFQVLCASVVSAFFSYTKIEPNKRSFTAVAGKPFPIITCTSRCQYQCEYRWYKFKNGPRMIHNNSAVLFRRTATREDEGNYMCGVQSRGKYFYSSLQIEISIVWQKAGIGIGNAPYYNVFQVGDNYTLYVYVTAKPYVNLTLLQNGEEVERRVTSTTANLFYFRNISCKTAGRYHLEADNGIGVSQSLPFDMRVNCSMLTSTKEPTENDVAESTSANSVYLSSGKSQGTASATAKTIYLSTMDKSNSKTTDGGSSASMSVYKDDTEQTTVESVVSIGKASAGTEETVSKISNTSSERMRIEYSKFVTMFNKITDSKSPFLSTMIQKRPPFSESLTRISPAPSFLARSSLNPKPMTFSSDKNAISDGKEAKDAITTHVSSGNLSANLNRQRRLQAGTKNGSSKSTWTYAGVSLLCVVLAGGCIWVFILRLRTRTRRFEMSPQETSDSLMSNRVIQDESQQEADSVGNNGATHNANHPEESQVGTSDSNPGQKQGQKLVRFSDHPPDIIEQDDNHSAEEPTLCKSITLKTTDEDDINTECFELTNINNEVSALENEPRKYQSPGRDLIDEEDKSEDMNMFKLDVDKDFIVPEEQFEDGEGNMMQIQSREIQDHTEIQDQTELNIAGPEHCTTQS